MRVFISFFIVAVAVACASAQGERARTRLTEENARIIVLTARQYGLPPFLVLEVMRHESAFNPNAMSFKDGKPCAHGLMQLIPATAKRFGVENPYDPAQAVAGGTKYLRFLVDRFGADRLDLVLAAYYGGEGLVEKAGRRVPPVCAPYVRAILTQYFRAERLAARPPSPAPRTPPRIDLPALRGRPR
jgi:soluble lytic murein transglycosylase-like protein